MNAQMRRGSLLKKLRKEWGWYMFISIPVLGTLVFNIYPVIISFITSLKNGRGVYIGLANYEVLLTDPLFMTSIKNTVYMGILQLCINLPLAFFLANMVNSVRTGKNVFKVMFLLPMIMSMVTVALIFKFIFSADPNGLMNSLFRALGLQPLTWLSSVHLSRETVVIMNVWKNVGYNVILFLAGLQSIPVELYEAASIDGANEFDKTRYITLPGIRNIFIFVYITTSINVLKKFTDVYAISGQDGDPGNTLLTIILYIYRKSFSTTSHTDIGVGSATAIILLLVIMIITLINLKITNRTNDT